MKLFPSNFKSMFKENSVEKYFFLQWFSDGESCKNKQGFWDSAALDRNIATKIKILT